MATKLLDPEKVIKWKFEDELNDPDGMVFYIKARTNKDRIALNYFATFGNRTLDDYIVDTYVNHIQKIENVPDGDGKKTVETPEEIKNIVERLPEGRGAELELAIRNIQGWLDRGTVKN